MKICLGYPQEEATIVALKAIRDFLEHDHNLVTYFKLFTLIVLYMSSNYKTL